MTKATKIGMIKIESCLPLEGIPRSPGLQHNQKLRQQLFGISKIVH
jgi:hypothetical protein